MEHLLELRKRLLIACGSVGVLFLVLLFFSQDLFRLIALPMLANLDQGMLAIGVATPFTAPLKLSLVLSVFLAIPILLYQLWAFIAPGLYKNERQLIWPVLIFSSLLFYLGAAFAYFLVCPIIFNFFAGLLPEGITLMPDMAQYLDFILKLLIAFGVAFEVPVIVVLCIATGVTTKENLAKKRPHIFTGAFVVGMLLTPPDVVSQILLAVPLWLLFELGLVVGSVMVYRRDEPEKHHRQTSQ